MARKQMDPEATLKAIRRLSDKSKLNFLTDDEIDELVELFDSLDGWMHRGGHKPKSWSEHD